MDSSKILTYLGNVDLIICNEKWMIHNRELDKKEYISKDMDLIKLIAITEEFSYNQFYNLLNAKINNKEIINAFPTLEIVKYSFENRLLGWVEYSLNWISEANLESMLKDWSRKYDVTWMPQQLQHKFFKTLQPYHQ